MSKYLEIVLNVPLNQSFTYLNREDSPASSLIGFRADVKFGNRQMRGFIVGESDTLPENLGFDPSKIRPITKIIDSKPVFNEDILETARWLSNYYLCTLGEAISSMLPGGKRESGTGGLGFSDDIDATPQNNLSDEQKKAVDEIVSDKSSIFHYLYGPTGSGKTEVFLQAAQKILEQDKGVIYLVPEISLTQQVMEAVIARFGKTAAVLHSGFTPSQKLSEWNRILNKEARVVVGARSAVFAPVPDLGLVIIDEEHDGSYKSGSTPRYHARQVAMHRCIKHKIPLLMGSATPSVEAWNMMNQGKIKKHSLTKRLAGGAMPLIKAIDLSNTPPENGSISPELKEEIDATLKEKRQVILFLNRRGFTHFFRCHSCGFELKCKNCSVSMTFHKNEKRLRCHYCGWSTVPPQQCPKCGSLDVGYSGFGTEFIENEVHSKFPAARVIRLDTDSLTKKGELQEKITQFKNGEYDILLGTQMVAKGLNFPNLKLVGVVLADTGLHMPDFRAAERTFSLITQVAGRAGRFFPDGRVLIQTYMPEQEPIEDAVNGNIQKFYENELATREMLNFPPFSRLIRIVFRAPADKDAETASQAATGIAIRAIEALKRNQNQNSTTLEQLAQTDVLGPSECPIVKLSMNYRHQIILRGPNVSILQFIARHIFATIKAPSSVYMECDVDPVALL